MSDGISDGRRERSFDDILETGAAWITEKELKRLGDEMKMFRGLWYRLRSAALKAQEDIKRDDREGAIKRLDEGIYGTPVKVVEED